MTTETPKKPFIAMQIGLVAAALVAAIFAVILTTKAAKAQTPLQIWAGVGVGYSHATTEVSSPLAPGFSIDGLGSKGMIGGIRGGVDMGLPGSAFFIGAFGDYTWQKVDFSINPIATARLGDAYTLGGRVGMVDGKSKYYVLLGYTSAESSLNVAGVTMPTFKGLTYGGGVSYSIAPNLAVGLEGRFTRFNSESVMGVVDLQPDQMSIMATMVVQLGNVPNPVSAPAPLK